LTLRTPGRRGESGRVPAMGKGVDPVATASRGHSQFFN